MYFTSIKIPFFILGALSLVCSRTLFFFIDDPEGPNLLIVVVLAAMIYGVSMTAYLFNLSKRTKFMTAVSIQLLLGTALALFFA